MLVYRAEVIKTPFNTSRDQTRPDLALPTTSDLISYEQSTASRGYSAWPIRLIAAERNRATETYPAVAFALADARIVAVGSHPYLPMSAAAWLSRRGEIIVAVQSDALDVDRDVLIRVWSRNTPGINRAVTLKGHGRGSVAFAEFPWSGEGVAGIILLPLVLPGEES